MTQQEIRQLSDEELVKIANQKLTVSEKAREAAAEATNDWYQYFTEQERRRILRENGVQI